MPRTTILAALIVAAAASGAAAQAVSECDWRAHADAIVEPWEDSTRTFANGDVRLAVLDTIEPGAGAVNILILSPPRDEMGGRQCRIVSLDRGIGFFDATLDGMDAGYDPAVGLIFTIPVELFVPETGMGRPARLRVTLNQATGRITAVLQ